MEKQQTKATGFLLYKYAPFFFWKTTLWQVDGYQSFRKAAMLNFLLAASHVTVSLDLHNESQ